MAGTRLKCVIGSLVPNRAFDARWFTESCSIAFSSEVATGSREENASNQKPSFASTSGDVPPRHKGRRQQRKHRLAALIDSAVTGLGDAPFGTLLGRPQRFA